MDDALRGAAEHEPDDAGAAVSRHDDEVGVPLRRAFDDRRRGVTQDVLAFNLDVLSLDLLYLRGDVLFGDLIFGVDNFAVRYGRLVQRGRWNDNRDSTDDDDFRAEGLGEIHRVRE